MKDIYERMAEASEWTNIGKYSSGKADMLATIFTMFDNELTDHTREWMRAEQRYRRDEAQKAFNKAVEALKGE